jgi:zinc transport system substrate-binding protein
MNRLNIFLVSIVALIFLVVGYVFFSTDKKEHEGGTLQVTASFYPLAYIASHVGGDRVTVKDLTPPGAEPHDFEPTLRDIVQIGEADLFLYNGGDFEPWVSAWNRGDFDRPRLSVDMMFALNGEDVSLIKNGETFDPHIWLDPMLMVKETEVVRDMLINLDPLSEIIYEENAERLIAKLVALDDEFRDGLRACEIRDFVASHEAFAYLAKTYDLSMIAIAGISPDEEPSPKTLAQISDLARSKNIKHIFFETAVSPKLSESIAREIGAETLVLNTLESLTLNEVQSGEDYIRVMQKNLTNLRKALSCL